jgi:hypothetical protein
VKVLLDDDGEELVDPSEASRFKEARAGDHLMTPFQCELCHFRNIMARDPVMSYEKDLAILEFSRQANLDAFWCRAKSTVAANLRAGLRMEKTADDYGMPSIAPPMGPFPLDDSVGMKAAIAVLDRSLDPGVYSECVQWGTFRKTRSAITNISQAGVSGLQDSVGAYERKHVWISTVVTHQFWFSRFITGVHLRVGEIRKPDELLTIDVLHEIHRILSREWGQAVAPAARKRVAEMGVWFVAGFCTGIRGEEKLLIEHAGTAKSLKHLTDAVDPHFEFVISGRTKGNQMSSNKFAVPCVGVTEGTSLRPGIWVERLVVVLREMGIKGGRLFTRRLLPAKLLEFEDDFYLVLEKVQGTTNLISKDIDVRAEYGISRSTRRGVTAHARNMEVPTELVNAVN